jgi:hypothetical protein
VTFDWTNVGNALIILSLVIVAVGIDRFGIERRIRTLEREANEHRIQMAILEERSNERRAQMARIEERLK